MERCRGPYIQIQEFQSHSSEIIEIKLKNLQTIIRLFIKNSVILWNTSRYIMFTLFCRSFSSKRLPKIHRFTPGRVKPQRNHQWGLFPDLLLVDSGLDVRWRFNKVNCKKGEYKLILFIHQRSPRKSVGGPLFDNFYHVWDPVSTPPVNRTDNCPDRN